MNANIASKITCPHCGQLTGTESGFCDECGLELTTQALKHSLLMLLPKMRDNFSITVLHKSMPTRFQLCPFFEVVKQFAIEDHNDVPVLIGHRLLTIRQADNAQPA